MHSLQQKSPITPNPRRAGEIRWSDGPALGYFTLRLWLGVVFTLYGATKLGKGPGAVAEGMVGMFKDTLLPAWSVRGFGLTLPFVELIVGLLLLLGLLTRVGLVLGGLTVVALSLGAALAGKSDLVSSQLLYAIAFFLLLATIRWNVIAVDRLLKPGFIEGIEIGGA